MRRRTVTKLELLPEPVGTYRDAEGYVYVDVPVAEADENGWVPLTMAQREHVKPMSEMDRARWRKAGA